MTSQAVKSAALFKMDSFEKIYIKFTWILVIKIFAINLPSQPFLGHHSGFPKVFFHTRPVR